MVHIFIGINELNSQVSFSGEAKANRLELQLESSKPCLQHREILTSCEIKRLTLATCAATLKRNLYNNIKDKIVTLTKRERNENAFTVQQPLTSG